MAGGREPCVEHLIFDGWPATKRIFRLPCKVTDLGGKFMSTWT